MGPFSVAETAAALSPEEQIAEAIATYDKQKAACGTSTCRDTVQSWEDAAVKKIKKKAGIVDAPAVKVYPSAPKVNRPAPSAPVEPPAVEVPAPPSAPAPSAPKAATSEVDAKAEARAAAAARLAERKAAADAAAEKKAADAAAAEKKAQEDARSLAEEKKAKIAAMEKAAAERKAAQEKAAAERKAADEKAAATKAAPAPAPAPAPAKKAEPPAKKAEPKKAAAAKPKSPGLGDYVVGDVTVAALAAAAATGILVPSVKDKALEGDVEGALADAKEVFSSIDGVAGKAAYVGGVIAVDAVAHLPLVGLLVPGPMEFVGTAAALLLAARYYVTKDGDLTADASEFIGGLPGGIPAADDIVNPVTICVNKLEVPDFEAVQRDVTMYFEDLDDPVDELAPKVAALASVWVASKVAHFPVVGLFAPRALELVGAACLIAAVGRYGRENTNVSPVTDIQRYVKQGGDAVMSAIGKK